MRIRNEERFVQSSGLKSTNAFQISASSHMFRVLSDGLYSDKVTAVIRELTCNARDAHTAAGKEDIPYKVHLPTILEPEFSVTDYGIGLCYEDIMSLYTTYGESLKNDSNDMIGGLGLGSKSPFAYVDQFTIEGRWHGDLFTFSCFVDKNGEPQIAHLTTAPSAEPNGLTIKMPVSSKDFGEFLDKATKLFQYYPENSFEANLLLEFEEREVVLEELGSWRVTTTKHDWYRYSYNDYKTNAIQGQVCYPISADKLTGVDPELLKLIKGTNIDIWFDIGKLEVAANREDLSYTPFTIKNIEARLHEVYFALVTEAEKQIIGATSLWDASIKAYDIYETFQDNRELGKSIITGMKWKGKHLHTESIDLTAVERGKIYKGKMRWIPASSSQNKYLSFRDMDSFCRWKMKELKYIDLYFADDPNQGKIPSTIQYHMGDEQRTIYLFEGEEKEFKKLLDYLGNPEYTRLSTLTPPPTQARGKAGPAQVKVFGGVSGFSSHKWMEDVTHDFTLGGVYIKYYQGNIDGRFHKDSHSCFEKYRYLNELGDTTQIFAVPATLHKKLEVNSKVWKSFEEHYEDTVAKQRKKYSDHKEVERYLTLTNIFKDGEQSLKFMVKVFKDSKETFKYPIINKILKDNKEYSKLAYKYKDKYITLQNLFSSKKDTVYIDDVEKKWQDVLDKHPVVKEVLDSYYHKAAYKEDLLKLLT